MIFVLLFENTTDRTIHTKYYLLTVEIKDYNVMIDIQNFIDQPIRTHDNIPNIVIGQGNDYTIGCLLD